MTRLRGSDADRRAWYEAHWRLRVDQPVVCATEVTEETLQAWADHLGGWVYFDRDAWMAAMRAAAGPNDEGPPTPTAMPRTLRWCRQPTRDEGARLLWLVAHLMDRVARGDAEGADEYGHEIERCRMRWLRPGGVW